MYVFIIAPESGVTVSHEALNGVNGSEFKSEIFLVNPGVVSRYIKLEPAAIFKSNLSVPNNVFASNEFNILGIPAKSEIDNEPPL